MKKVKHRHLILIKKHKMFALASILVTIFGVYLFVFNSRGGLPHSNIVDKTISLNGRQNISQSSKVTDSRFVGIAFAESKKKSLLPSQIAAVVRTVKSLAKQEPISQEYGTWIWTPLMLMTPKYIESILDEASSEGINTIYLSIDSYLDVYAMPEGLQKERQKKEFGDTVENFIKEANERGMEVDAEAGWRNWVEDGNEYKAFAVAEYVKDFNSSRTSRFRGFQYDVEPYLLKKFEWLPAAVLEDFVELVSKTEEFLGEDLRFSVVIPDFYDEMDKATPSFKYNGRKASVLKHLLDILDRRNGNSLVLMSYRNFADGADGSIEVSKNELETARRGYYNTKIVVAQETGDFPPPYITFHGTSKKYFEAQISKINNEFGGYSNFGGIAVHYVNSFLELK